MDIQHTSLLSRLCDANNVVAAAEAFTLGALLHIVALRKAELESYIKPLLLAFLIAFPAAVYQYSTAMSVSIPTSLGRISLILASFTSGLLTSLFTYCAFFHPLRNFPGPFPARLTKFYSIYLSAKHTQYHKELARMHDQYGDFVRTGPRELTINRTSVVEVLQRTKCWKSNWADQVSTSDRVASFPSTRNRVLYKLRKKGWDRAFTQKATEQYLPNIILVVEAVVSKLSAAGLENPQNVTMWAKLLNFDILTIVGLGKPAAEVTCVETETEHPALKAIIDHMGILAHLAHVPWFLNLLASILGASGSYPPLRNFCREQLQERRRSISIAAGKNDDGGDETVPTNVLTPLIRAFAKSPGRCP